MSTKSQLLRAEEFGLYIHPSATVIEVPATVSQNETVVTSSFSPSPPPAHIENSFTGSNEEIEDEKMKQYEKMRVVDDYEDDKMKQAVDNEIEMIECEVKEVSMTVDQEIEPTTGIEMGEDKVKDVIMLD